MAGVRRYLTAQSLIEYVLLLTIVVMAIVVMFPRVRRTSQSLIKSAADQIGDQKGGEQDFSEEAGYVKASTSKMQSAVQNQHTDDNGSIQKTFNEHTSSSTVTESVGAWVKY
ncbi:MAG: hypothetical protein V2A70_04250 [Candidatus Omnitrophota bacterium]